MVFLAFLILYRPHKLRIAATVQARELWQLLIRRLARYRSLEICVQAKISRAQLRFLSPTNASATLLLHQLRAGSTTAPRGEWDFGSLVLLKLYKFRGETYSVIM